MRVAVVSNRWRSSWDEMHMITRRFAGALACSADVDLCVAEGPSGGELRDGAVRVLRFPAAPVDVRHAEALVQAVLGPMDRDGVPDVASVSELAIERAKRLPRSIQEELVFASGGHSPALYAHLREGRYDVVLFAGHHSAATYLGMRAVPAHCRVALWPAATSAPFLHLPLYDETFARADVFVTCMRAEERLVRRRLNGTDDRQAACVSFALRVNSLAAATIPNNFEPKHRYLVVARDWERDPAESGLAEWARAIERDFGEAGVKVCLVGPGADQLRRLGGMPLASSRIDVWRWMNRAFAVLDTRRNQLLGREVLEAMLCGATVLVHAEGAAAREHAEAANGGLWFRTYAQLVACVRELLVSGASEVLGRQGKDYAVREVGDPDAFVARLSDAVLR